MTRKHKMIVSALMVSALIGAAALSKGRVLPPKQSLEKAGDITHSVPRSPARGPLRLDLTNPRYFTDGSGKTVYLTGSHTWNNLQNWSDSSHPTLDYTCYLRLLRGNNHNFMRLWVAEQAAWAPWTTEKVRFFPLPYRRPGPGTALDGEPRFDVMQFNEEYFDRLRSRVSAARDHGIYVAVMLFQGWSVGKQPNLPGNPWRGHPFHRMNNVNGINGDLNGDDEGKETHTLQVPAITDLQERYVRKVVDTLNDLDNVLWEISNESDPGSKEWQYHMIRFIKSYEADKPKQHPVGMTAYPGGTNADLFESPADWISPSGRSDDYQENPPLADGRKVIIADTDHLWGLGGDRAWVWKSFIRGLNPIFMDPVDDPNWESARRAMGQTLAYADQINLGAMTPHNELSSSGYCLAHPGNEYLVYLPFEAHWLESARFFHRFKQQIQNIRSNFKRNVVMDLTLAPGTFLPEWMNPSTGERKKDKEIRGGDRVRLTAPFKGDAVLHLRRVPSTGSYLTIYHFLRRA
jgi:Family of unknown function (DUF6298)